LIVLLFFLFPLSSSSRDSESDGFDDSRNSTRR